MPRKALIIVDMLNDFLDPQGALYCGDASQEIIPFVQKRLQEYRKANDFVIYLRDAHDKDDKEFEKFPPHCVAGTWGGDFLSEIQPNGAETVIAKKRFSGFYGTDLENVLHRHGIEQVEVVGVCTSICVMDTVGGLANRDYATVVPVKGVADFDQAMHDIALKRMQQLYGAKVI